MANEQQTQPQVAIPLPKGTKRMQFRLDVSV